MRTLNLGILAHVDAGKTSLTERLLYAAGVIDEVGSVDDGSTQTDFLSLERRRGITIRSAVVSFVVGDVTVNLIDTPGHPDFIAEVERVLGVLDGAVLVVSAVEGVQAQTRVLMRTLQRLAIPTLLFVNKIDRTGADDTRVHEQIVARLSPAVLPLGAAHGLGTREAEVTAFGRSDHGFVAALAELLADHDETVLAAYVEARAPLSYDWLRRRLADRTAAAAVHPVLSGSAITGAGVDLLIEAITSLLPTASGDPKGPVSGTVFKIERGASGEKIAYVRMVAGTLHTRDQVSVRHGPHSKVTAIAVFDRGAVTRADSVGAGRIAKVWGLAGVRIGDTIGASPQTEDRHVFAPPTLETVVSPLRSADRGALHLALSQLAEQDPLIDLRQDERSGDVFVSLYGEVQKEVIEATLADEFSVEVTFRDTTTLYIERLVGSGESVELIGDDGNPFLAGVGLRVEPGPQGSGIGFRLGIEPGSLPLAFQRAVEEAATAAMRQGIHGWEVLDCVITLTRSGYWPRQSHAHGTFDKSMSSTAGDFRNLTPLVLFYALRQAGTRVYEPMHRFRLDLPADAYGAVLPVLTRRRGIPSKPEISGSTYVVEGLIPAEQVHALQQELPGVTSGEGVLESAFSGYQFIGTAPPTRPRSDHNPLDRKEYLLHVLRRV